MVRGKRIKKAHGDFIGGPPPIAAIDPSRVDDKG
jgi:hypothetical protein